jgi:hypothetical protein
MHNRLHTPLAHAIPAAQLLFDVQAEPSPPVPAVAHARPLAVG